MRQELVTYLAMYPKGYNNTNAIRWLWKNNPSLWEEIKNVTSFLDIATPPKQRCWHILHDCYHKMICPNTGNELKWQGSRYYRYEGTGSHMKDSSVVKRKQESFFMNHGVDNPMKLSIVRDKLKQTMLESYGVDNYFKTESVRSNTTLAWNDPIKRQIRIDNIKTAFIKKYGCYPCQVPEISEKIMLNQFRWKNYTLPSGRVIKVQGYEPRALDELLMVYDEINIITSRKEVPRIKYQYDGKTKIYFPDIYIPSENKIIEVKSFYTYNRTLLKNIEKQKACIAAGFLFEFRIYK